MTADIASGGAERGQWVLQTIYQACDGEITRIGAGGRRSDVPGDWRHEIVIQCYAAGDAPRPQLEGRTLRWVGGAKPHSTITIPAVGHGLERLIRQGGQQPSAEGCGNLHGQGEGQPAGSGVQEGHHFMAAAGHSVDIPGGRDDGLHTVTPVQVSGRSWEQLRARFHQHAHRVLDRFGVHHQFRARLAGFLKPHRRAGSARISGGRDA